MSWLVSHGVQPDTVNDLRSGGAERDRTVDPLLAKQVLSQLSYSPIANYQRSGELTAKLVGLGRFELPTSPLSGVRSNQLSYRPGLVSTPGLLQSCQIKHNYNSIALNPSSSINRFRGQG